VLSQYTAFVGVIKQENKSTQEIIQVKIPMMLAT
jgi:hypothetical protein